MSGADEGTLASLAAASAAFTRLDPAARAGVARDTALAVAAVADQWVEAAVAIKQGEGPNRGAIVAEETATGPLASMRLLLITERCLRETAALGTPRPSGPLQILHRGGGDALFVGVDVVPERWLADRAMFGGTRGTVRCGLTGDLTAFERAWREECRERPRRGGVTLVLGAGNVTGLAVADAVCQVFEHGRATLLKLHPLHAQLTPVFRDALAPLVSRGLVAIVAGGADVAAAAVASPVVTHVHLTGGQAAFDAITWGPGGPRPGAAPALAKPITCELGGVTPWIVVPGGYTPAQLRTQADLVAGSILNNSSFNCIATKCVITCRSWPQRAEFMALVERRLAESPPRRGWYPGAPAAWEEVAGRRPPPDGTLPWVFRTGVDPEREPRWLEREWFVPVAVETPLDADDLEAFCGRAMAAVRRLPGSLAASVTVPDGLPPHDRQRVERLVEHLEYGTVGINTWSALGYALGSLPWGGFPGGTLAEPRSGIGFVHDPLCLPLIHNSILRGPLAQRSTPPWVSWHRHGAALARGVVEVYAALARGRSGLWPLTKMLPQVLAG